MKNSKKGFTLVEVVVAIAVIAIISAVTITLVATSGDMLNEADDVIWASAEARNVADCYAKSIISGGDEADFIERVGIIHGIADMGGKYFVSGTETKIYKFYFDVDDAEGIHSEFKLVDKPANDRFG